MTADDRLRRLERSFQETGNAEDEAAYLREAVRTGKLAAERLELAAYLGHPPAELALEQPPPAPPEPAEDEERPREAATVAWFVFLERWGQQVVWRAGAALMRNAPIHTWNRFDGPDDRLLEVMDRLEARILGEADHVQGCADLLREAAESGGGGALNLTDAVRVLLEEPGSQAQLLPQLAGTALYSLSGDLRGTVRSELVPWALGRGDPLRERPLVGGARLGQLDGLVRNVAFRPGHPQELLAVTDGGLLQLYGLDPPAPTRELARVPRDPYASAWSPRGDLLAVGGGVDQRLRLLDGDSGQELAALELKVTPSRLAWLNDTWLAVPAADGAVGVWRADGELELLRTLGEPGAPGDRVSCLSAGQGLVFAAGRELPGRLWDGRSGELLGELQTGRPLEGAWLLPGGAGLVTSDGDCALRVWDLPGLTARLGLEGHTGTVQALAASPDGRLLASAGSDGSLRVWDLPAAREQACWYPRGTLLAVAFSADGRRVVVGSRRGGLRVYPIE